MKVHVSAPLGVVVNIQTLGGGRDSVGSDDCEANGQKKTLLEVYFFYHFITPSIEWYTLNALTNQASRKRRLLIDVSFQISFITVVVRHVRRRKPARSWVRGFKSSSGCEPFSCPKIPAGRTGAERPAPAALLQRAGPVRLQATGVRLGNPPLLRRKVLPRRTTDPVFRDEPRTFRHGADRGEDEYR